MNYYACESCQTFPVNNLIQLYTFEPESLNSTECQMRPWVSEGQNGKLSFLFKKKKKNSVEFFSLFVL